MTRDIGDINRSSGALSTVVQPPPAILGEDVSLHLPRGQRSHKDRAAYLAERLCSDGVVDAALRIPHTAGDLEIAADLRAQQLVASIDIGAPLDRGARGRVSWLVRQLDEAPATLVVEAYPKNARALESADLGAVRDDRSAVLTADRKEPHRFRLVTRSNMGMLRKTGRKSIGFIDSVQALVESFYADVVQHLAAWQTPAPKLERSAATKLPQQSDQEPESDDE